MQVKSLRGRDFIAISDFTKEEIVTMLDAGKALKLENARGVPHHILQDKTIFLMFYNKSLRTRNSFETGIFQMGGHANYLTTDAVYTPAIEGKEQAFVTERLDDVAKVLSRYGEAICIRIFGDPVSWVHGDGNAYMRAFAKAADVPVINMEDDLYHPCQGMADLMTMEEKLGTLEGKKVVISWAYSPSRRKPVSVPHSMMAVTSLFGAHVVFAHPKGFELDKRQIANAKSNVARYGGSFTETNDMKEAFKDADVVYPKCWPAIQFLATPDKEPDWKAQDKLFDANKNWICDEKIMKLTNRDSIYMHCLPCDRSYEVTDAVIDGPHSVVYDQAENRMHAQNGVMALLMNG
jgi:N-acetylornithine carbamoyltransferase